MASGLQQLAEMEFQGGGSQSASVELIVMCAQVVGEITRDEQLLTIAQKLPGVMGGGPKQPPHGQPPGPRSPQGFQAGQPGLPGQPGLVGA